MTAPDPDERTPEEIIAHYTGMPEADRLLTGLGRLERVRTEEIMGRHLPEPPARVLDVGGGSGVHACSLARLGYEVHLVDPVPVHLEQARDRSAAETPIASIAQGDARALAWPDASFDAVLLLGPLYHLTDERDRERALREARRVLRGGGRLFAAALSRYASVLDGLTRELLLDPVFVEMVDDDLATGRHRNPTDDPNYFTTAYLHEPSELAGEIRAAGFTLEDLLGIEGPAWLLPDFDERWEDEARRAVVLETVRRIEREPSLLGVSAHLLAVARRMA